MRNVALLGSTGSIGKQALEIARKFSDKVSIRTLSASVNADLLIRQALEFSPDCVVIVNEDLLHKVQSGLSGTDITVLTSAKGLVEAARWPGVDTLISAIVGSAGVRPTIAAMECGSRIALANKETLVVAGEIIMPLAERYGAEIIPIDSEHSAIFQCLQGEMSSAVDHLVLTASGGPFRDRDRASFSEITREETLKHPNWDMGDKITVDSATLMNKGLEVIEARWLFDLPADKIRVILHPQSIIHSMVTFCDGSVKAQLGMPDMKLPIQYALSYPDRWEGAFTAVPWTLIDSLEFEEPDTKTFPCLNHAYEALRAGGHAPAILNAANEVAVDLFLRGKIPFTEIPVLIEQVSMEDSGSGSVNIESLTESDAWARRRTTELSKVGSH